MSHHHCDLQLSCERYPHRGREAGNTYLLSPVTGFFWGGAGDSYALRQVFVLQGHPETDDHTLCKALL